MLVAGVDIGATYLRCAIGENGKILCKKREPTRKDSPHSLVSQITEMVSSLLEQTRAKISGLAVASAGPLDLRRGMIVNSPNLGLKKVPIVRPLRREFNVPVYLLNDCTAGVIGEWRFGKGKKARNLVYITISTGIGAGVIVDGRVLMGKDGNAHEIGHTVIDMEGRLTCGCGKRGHWEAYCSGTNLPRYVKMRASELSVKLEEELTAEKVFERARKGDRFFRMMVEEIGRLNAMGVANAVNAYDPELLVLGGSVVLKNASLVLGPIKRHVDQYLLNRKPKITVTSLGEEVVLYGSLAVASRPELIGP